MPCNLAVPFTQSLFEPKIQGSRAAIEAYQQFVANVMVVPNIVAVICAMLTIVAILFPCEPPSRCSWCCYFDFATAVGIDIRWA